MKKMIITDTNIITDLNNGGILEEFVMLDNVFISDMVKSDEINNNTGDIDVIEKFKIIEASPDQIIEIYQIKNSEKRLSEYDIINFILARDSDAILATGDNRLKTYSEANGVEVIRTLKIIELMVNKGVISIDKGVNACNKLINNERTRIPKDDIKSLINELQKSTVVN